VFSAAKWAKLALISPKPEVVMPGGPPHVIWRTYHPNWFRKQAPAHVRAILVERQIGVSGKPVLREVGYVSSYDTTRIAEPEVQREFWTRARFQLGKLRLAPNQIAVIEQQLARRVPSPELRCWSDPTTVLQSATR
jgi:hypothetical protein